MTKPLHRSMWCDGLVPEEYLFSECPPRITGVAWICGRKCWDQPWRFSLILPPSIRVISDIDWFALLPPDDMTCWIWFDEKLRYLELDPLAAVPDRS